MSIDITERVKSEELIRHMAQHDGLTSLPNRALFSDRLGQALAMARRSGTRLAVLFVDLNGFKPVNDTHGHGVGDLVLKETARRLLDCVRESDGVGRIGGDEFVVYLRTMETRDQVKQLCSKIQSALERPFEIEGLVLHLSASVGQALYPDDASDESSLLTVADADMYRVKKASGQKDR